MRPGWGNSSCQTVVVGRAWCLTSGSDQTLVLPGWAMGKELTPNPALDYWLTLCGCRGPWLHGWNSTVWKTWTSWVCSLASELAKSERWCLDLCYMYIHLLFWKFTSQIHKLICDFQQPCCSAHLFFSFLKHADWSSLTETLRSGLKRSWFKGHLIDECLYGNLLMFELTSQSVPLGADMWGYYMLQMYEVSY